MADAGLFHQPHLPEAIRLPQLNTLRSVQFGHYLHANCLHVLLTHVPGLPEIRLLNTEITYQIGSFVKCGNGGSLVHNSSSWIRFRHYRDMDIVSTPCLCMHVHKQLECKRVQLLTHLLLDLGVVDHQGNLGLNVDVALDAHSDEAWSPIPAEVTLGLPEVHTSTRLVPGVELLGLLHGQPVALEFVLVHLGTCLKQGGMDLDLKRVVCAQEGGHIKLVTHEHGHGLAHLESVEADRAD